VLLRINNWIEMNEYYILKIKMFSGKS